MPVLTPVPAGADASGPTIDSIAWNNGGISISWSPNVPAGVSISEVSLDCGTLGDLNFAEHIGLESPFESSCGGGDPNAYAGSGYGVRILEVGTESVDGVLTGWSGDTGLVEESFPPLDAPSVSATWTNQGVSWM